MLLLAHALYPVILENSETQTLLFFLSFLHGLFALFFPTSTLISD